MLASGEKYTSLRGKVSFRVVSNRQHSLFLVGINPSVLSHLWCIQPHIDLISNTHTHIHTHININYNYFELIKIYFQQIQGTAMGAAFSPSLANIFMSVILRRFLNTKTSTHPFPQIY